MLHSKTVCHNDNGSICCVIMDADKWQHRISMTVMASRHLQCCVHLRRCNL